GLPDRLVWLRQQGPAHAPPPPGARPLRARLLRPGQLRPLPGGPGLLAARGAGSSPRRALPRPQRGLPRRRPDLLRRDPLPPAGRGDPAPHPLAEPPDLPAGGRDPGAPLARVRPARRRTRPPDARARSPGRPRTSTRERSGASWRGPAAVPGPPA